MFDNVYSNRHFENQLDIALTETKSGDSGLHDWFNKSKSSDGKKGWVQLGGEYAGKPCARQPGQKSTPKCGSSKMKRKLSSQEEEKAFRRKNQKDPNQPNKSGGARPTNVSTEAKDRKGRNSGKKDSCYYQAKRKYDVFPSAYASGYIVQCRNRSKSESTQCLVDINRLLRELSDHRNLHN